MHATVKGRCSPLPHIPQNNFLVDAQGRPYLTDIGVRESMRGGNFPSSWRYLPRKEYDVDEDIVLTKYDDVHAFAMSMIEVSRGRGSIRVHER